MKSLATKLDGDPEVWEILGIIHDSDWEETKDAIEKHTVLTLQRVDDERFVHALKSHNTRHTHLAELEGPMEWALECCDELTGFIVACTLVLPSKKIADLTVESVLKKFPKRNLPKQLIDLKLEFVKKNWELNFQTLYKLPYLQCNLFLPRLVSSGF